MPSKLKLQIRLARLNSPLPILLLLIPCIWAIALSKAPISPEKLLAIVIGSVAMRSLGCIINDLADMKFDRNIARTKLRPLASDSLRRSDAIAPIIFFAVVSFACLVVVATNYLVWLLAVAAIFLTTIYPFAKRFTYLPQVILGITFNLGLLISYCSFTGKIDHQSIMLYLAAICATIGYDTVYGYQDLEDDKKNNLKSTAILFGDSGKYWISGFYLCELIFLLLALQSISILIILAIIYLLYNLFRSEYNLHFKHNIISMILILCAIMIS